MKDCDVHFAPGRDDRDDPDVGGPQEVLVTADTTPEPDESTLSEEDILRIGATMLSRPPSIAAHGEDLSKVPAFDTIKQWRLK